MPKNLIPVIAASFSLVFSVSCSTSKTSANQQAAEANLGITTTQQPAVVAIQQPPYQPSATMVHDLINTRLEVSFDWEKQYLHGLATLTLKPYFYPQTELVLDAKGFDIHSINLQKPKNTPLQYNYDGRKLTIQLDKEYTRHEQFVIEIDYTAKPNELEDTDKGDGAPIREEKGLYFINPLGTEEGKPQQIWTQGETHGSSAWFPTIDQPNERMTQDIYMRVDKKYTTLSNGTLMYKRENADGTRTDYWKMELPHAPYLTMMAVGEFAVVKDKWRNLEVNYYVEPKYESTAKQIFGNTPEMMEFFSQKLGVDYPWDKYSQIVVRDFVSGAMENTTASVFMEAVQADARELLDENWDGIIAHELFHHWFGDYVTCESWAQLPLNESFADYSEMLWAGHKYGPDAAAFEQQNGLYSYLAESQYKQVPLIRHHYHAPNDMFDSHSYAKGGRILHMLHKLVGDEAFFASLSLYLKKHKFSSVEIDELRMAFEDVTGQDMKWFFDQWFHTPGHPVLNVSHSYANGKITVHVRQLQDTTKATVYKLPLQIAWWEGSKRQVQPVTISKTSETFTFDAAARPDLVLFDAEQQLLAEVTHEKTDTELIFQLKNSNLYAPKSEAIQKLSSKLTNPEARQAILATINNPFHELRSEAIQAFANYKGDGSEQIAAALEKVATTDKKRPVRAVAIEVLSTISENPKYVKIYQAGLQDSSYSVIAASAQALVATNSTTGLTQIEALEDSEVSQITVAVANYYAEANTPGKQPWFENQIKKAETAGHSGTLFGVLQDYGKYLMKQDAAAQQRAVPQLANLAKTADKYYVRITAYQALSLLDETEGLKKLKKEIRDTEKDPRLQRFYQQMQ